MSYSNDRNATSLNQAATDDTGLYDESRHDNQIVAMYDTDADARAARDKLVGQGVPDSSMHLVSRESEPSMLGGTNVDRGDDGIWSALKGLFVPDDDRSAYSHAVGRGHAMLVVVPTAGMDRTGLVHALEATNPVDFDVRLQEWRESGYDASAPHADYAATLPMATGTATTARDAAGSEPEYPTPPATATPVGSTATTTDYSAGSAAVSGSAMPGGTATRAEDDTIKVFEERLRVGKREVAAGAMRIRSYIVERPVEEQVSLHSETVQVERRPVDRAATADDLAAFQERTIEARASSEEAVVSKDARVVEEIGLKKTASDRVETVRDTVRKTEVEIEDGATIDPATGKPRAV